MVNETPTERHGTEWPGTDAGDSTPLCVCEGGTMWTERTLSQWGVQEGWEQPMESGSVLVPVRSGHHCGFRE